MVIVLMMTFFVAASFEKINEKMTKYMAGVNALSSASEAAPAAEAAPPKAAKGALPARRPWKYVEGEGLCFCCVLEEGQWYSNYSHYMFICRAGRKLLEGLETSSDGNIQTELLLSKAVPQKVSSQKKLLESKTIKKSTPVKRKRDVTDSCELSGRPAEEFPDNSAGGDMFLQ